MEKLDEDAQRCKKR